MFTQRISALLQQQQHQKHCKILSTVSGAGGCVKLGFVIADWQVCSSDL